jgi:hypothetical protein
VIDLDEIIADLFGGALYERRSGWLERGLEERNARLRALAQDDTARSAWFIVSAPTADERAWWCRQLVPEQLIVLDVPEEECALRIMADVSRRGRQDQHLAVLRDWWRTYRQCQ